MFFININSDEYGAQRVQLGEENGNEGKREEAAFGAVAEVLYLFHSFWFSIL